MLLNIIKTSGRARSQTLYSFFRLLHAAFASSNWNRLGTGSNAITCLLKGAIDSVKAPIFAPTSKHIGWSIFFNSLVIKNANACQTCLHWECSQQRDHFLMHFIVRPSMRLAAAMAMNTTFKKNGALFISDREGLTTKPVSYKEKIAPSHNV